MNYLILYVIISVIIGIRDLYRLKSQQNYLASVPIGDIGDYVVPKRIFGIHNFMFLPSLTIIVAVFAVRKLTNRVS